MTGPSSSSPDRPKIVALTISEKWRIEHAIQEAAAQPHRHVRTTVCHDGKEYRVVVYERRNDAKLLAEREQSAAATH